MLEGVLRHCIDITIKHQMTDSHGQSEIGFASSHLLGFRLLHPSDDGEHALLRQLVWSTNTNVFVSHLPDITIQTALVWRWEEIFRLVKEFLAVAQEVLGQWKKTRTDIHLYNL